MSCLCMYSAIGQHCHAFYMQTSNLQISIISNLKMKEKEILNIDTVSNLLIRFVINLNRFHHSLKGIRLQVSP